MKQYLKLKLNQKLSPQQIQLMKLIQLPTIDFEQKIKQELEENPALEIKDNSNDALDEDFSNSNEDELNNESIDDEDINIEDYINYDDTPAYKLSYNTNNDSENSEIPLASGISFTEYLLNQLNTLRLNDDEAKIAEFLVGSIDNSGYLRQNTDEIIDDLAFTQNIEVSTKKLNKILSIVQQLDPPGVGAQSLQECLILQLKRKPSNKQIDLANNIIKKSFDQFSKKHFNKLIEKYDINDFELNKINIATTTFTRSGFQQKIISNITYFQTYINEYDHSGIGRLCSSCISN